MSTNAASAPASLTADSTTSNANKALLIGLAGIAATFVGFFVYDKHAVALSWLVGVTYWTAIAIGMLLMVLIHHIFDASWSVVIRRQWEHGLAAFPWLALLFLPLILATLFYKRDLIWPWLDLAHPLRGGE